MNRARTTLFATLLVAVGALADPPAILRETETDRAIWASESALNAVPGDIDWGLLEEVNGNALLGLFENRAISSPATALRRPDPNVCDLRLGAASVDPAPRMAPWSLDERARQARVLARGRVVSREAGVMGMFAGTLFTIAVEETLPGVPEAQPSELFLFLPIGDLRLGAATICMRDPRFPVLAEDDEVILTLMSEEPGEAVVPTASEVIAFRAHTLLIAEDATMLAAREKALPNDRQLFERQVAELGPDGVWRTLLKAAGAPR